MPVYELEESTWAGPIADDTIMQARITGIKEIEKDEWENGSKTGNKLPRLEWSFMVEDQESAWDGQKLWGETSRIFTRTTNCKFYNWSKEILGVDDLPKQRSDGSKFAIDTDVLVGETCRVIVGSREYEKDGETKTRNWVKDVLRASSKMGGGGSLGEDEPF